MDPCRFHSACSNGSLGSGASVVHSISSNSYRHDFSVWRIQLLEQPSIAVLRSVRLKEPLKKKAASF
jgi:hypothetical protein